MKSLRESLFDDGLISKDIRFGDLYELNIVHLQSPYCFNKLYTKKIISQYPKWAKEKNLYKYWRYYGNDNNYKSPPPEMEKVCNVIIKMIEEFPMSKVNGQSQSKLLWNVFDGSYDSLSNSLRSYIRDFINQYIIGMHPHSIYIDSDYKYHGSYGYIQILIGKNTNKGRYSIPDRMEFIFKKI